MPFCDILDKPGRVVLCNTPKYNTCLCIRGQGGITEGLVKGALSVAASAYKALFTGPNCSIQVRLTTDLMPGISKMHGVFIVSGDQQ